MQGKSISRNASSPRLNSAWSIRRSSSSQSMVEDEYAHVNTRSKQDTLRLLKYSHRHSSMSSRPNLTRGGSSVRKHACPTEEFPRSVERVKLHMKSPILFDRQLSRPAQISTNAHESRFTVINDYPVISTKYRRVVSPDFGKSLGRIIRKGSCSPATECNPIIEVVKCRAGFDSPQWKTKQGRNSNTPKLEKALNYVVNFSSVDKQVAVPLFDKSSSRPQSSMGSLPSFMCKINSRQAIRLISEKSLKMSKYAEWDYYVPESTFSSLAFKSTQIANSAKSSPRRARQSL